MIFSYQPLPSSGVHLYMPRFKVQTRCVSLKQVRAEPVVKHELQQCRSATLHTAAVGMMSAA
jgi:hypothetical protein